MDDSPSVGRQRSYPRANHIHGSCLLLEVKLNFLKKTVTCPRPSLLFRAAYQPLDRSHNMSEMFQKRIHGNRVWVGATE